MRAPFMMALAALLSTTPGNAQAIDQSLRLSLDSNRSPSVVCSASSATFALDSHSPDGITHPNLSPFSGRHVNHDDALLVITCGVVLAISAAGS